jgi:L-asparaginase II
MTSAMRATVAPLVRVVRSGFHECTHYGAAVITDADGSVRAAVGPVDEPIFPRSSAKPFQAVAMLEAGAALTDADLALAAGSHAGEPQHTERALAMLHRAGLAEDDLRCPEDYPLDEATRLALLRDGRGKRRIYMNCSGKHTGMLLACAAAGWSLPDYPDPEHPLQRAARAVVEDLSGQRVVATGVDGCGAPVFGITLVGLARAFGRVAAGPAGSSAARVATAMRAFPQMVAGTGRDDTRLMTAYPQLLVKGGAEGVHTAALPDGRAIALKVSDGAERARMPVLMAALRRLGLESGLIEELARGTILGGGRPVGTVEAFSGLFD